MQRFKILFALAVFFSFSCIMDSCSNSNAKTKTDQRPGRMEVLFLGHSNNANHDSNELASILSREYFRSGINLSFTSDPNDLNSENLRHFAGLIVYANHDSISPNQEKALLQFVRGGKGLVAIHSASFCFRNSDEVVEMIGGQFKSHKYDTIQTVILNDQHPVLEGITSFKTLDETYVHDKLSSEIEVLTERVEGDHHEPYTWVRPYGEGRVFYTAYGHDTNTFNNQGFLDLIKNGLLWAVGDEEKAILEKVNLANTTYYEGLVPNYEKRDPAPLVQTPLTPEESMSLMQVPVDFELELFAAEPMIINPIYMNWDEKGRLWVIETVDYPNEIKVDDLGDDRIKILEDTDGDGKADKSTIFADKLNIPTSFVFSNGGIIVSQSPSFLFLKDTDGDDVADVKEEILSGWGKGDTHAQASNLRYGMDNMIWGVVGYSGFNGPRVQGTKDTLRLRNSMYRFDPNSRSIEHIADMSNNTWGLGFSEDFDVFGSTANNEHSTFIGIPKRYFESAGINENGAKKLDSHYDMRYGIKNLRQVDVMGGFTAAAGHSLYTARDFPKSYWNKVAFVTEPTGRLVHRVNLKQEGAGFIEDEDGWNLLTSGDEWAGPIQAEVGPDGAVWIADWYNFIIQHNPTPSVNSSGVDAINGKGNAYINPLRDRSRGRIYRVVHKKSNNKSNKSINLNNTRGMISALSNDNMFWRLTAQRLLVEKQDKSVFSKLYALVNDTKLDEIGLNPGAIHALWTLKGLGAFEEESKEATNALLAGLNHPSAGVRRAAIQVMPKNMKSFTIINDSGVFDDQDLRVRLAAVLATTEINESQEVATALVNMAEKSQNFEDEWLKHALTIASKQNTKGFRSEFAKRGLDVNPSLMNASLAQRLAFGSNLNSTSLRPTYRPGSQTNPELVNSEFIITGDMSYRGDDDKPEYNGVMMAYGNKRNGLGLYFMNNAFHFVLNQNGQAYKVSTTKPLTDNFSFSAGLQKDGTMSLLINNQEVGSKKVPGLFKKEFDESLRVIFEREKGSSKVANYPDDYFMERNNRLRNGEIEILKVSEIKDENQNIAKVIRLKTVKEVMKYDKELITAEAGTTIQIVLDNPDFMQHNLVLIEPNSSEKVGKEADLLARHEDGMEMNYIPIMSEVLAATPLINAGGSYTLTIELPNIPGDYPYICTFPGHWRMMKGVLRVTGKKAL